MVRRRQFREMEVLKVLLMQGVEIRCFRCCAPITLEQVAAKQVQKEHLHELELGGADMPENCRYSHADCHAVITNGTPATSAGSSKHRIAKTHPNRTEKFVVNKQPLGLTVNADPGTRCHRCGEYLDACRCPPPAKPNGFGRKPAVRA
jgi:hypothetical protein